MNCKKLFLLGATFCYNVNSANVFQLPTIETSIDAVACTCAWATVDGLLLRFRKFIGEKIHTSSNIACFSGESVAAVILYFFNNKDTVASCPQALTSLQYLQVAAGVVGVSVATAVLIATYGSHEEYKFKDDVVSLLGVILLEIERNNSFYSLPAIPIASICARSLFWGGMVAIFAIAYPIFKKFLSTSLGLIGVHAAITAAFTSAIWAAITARSIRRIANQRARAYNTEVDLEAFIPLDDGDAEQAHVKRV
jgi:hypothetical protein